MKNPERDWPQPVYSSIYVAKLIEMLEMRMISLPEDVGAALRTILTDRTLDDRQAEDKIADLADETARTDETLLYLWAEARAGEPDRRRGWGTHTPSRRSQDGPTRRWRCPESGCSTDEPGLEWAPSTMTHCPSHPDRELVPHPLSPGT
ncbi:hypothetical protein [Streptosporangium sp. LJ11]|uniref:hypothetical protein n=1 Tax=Streptosporangium sp. LJ11 TaxID=3436927 RepID=UPI003F7A9F31